MTASSVSNQTVNSEGQQDIRPGTMHHSTFRDYIRGFHRRYCQIDYRSTQSYDLFVSRVIAILILLYTLIIEFLAHSGIMKPSMTFLNFLFGSSYSLKDIAAITYASGAVAYGASIEIYIILPLSALNAIFAIHNCGFDHQETIASIVYIIKACALLLGTELSYQNFQRFTFQQSYRLHYQSACRAMLRQSIYLTVTILFLVAPGLRAIHSAVRFKCPYSNETSAIARCSMIDFERPVSEENASCVADFTAFIAAIEQLRLIRDIALFSMAFYSMYNKGFLDITGVTARIHKMMLFLFFGTSCSVLAVNIDPLHFNQMKLYFNMIELCLFAVLMILLIVNLRQKSDHRQFLVMQENPTIFG